MLDSGPELTPARFRQWLARIGVKTLFNEPGRPWENGCVESSNCKLRDGGSNCESFQTLLEAQVLIERLRHEYNTFRPSGSPGYRPPARGR